MNQIEELEKRRVTKIIGKTILNEYLDNNRYITIFFDDGTFSMLYAALDYGSAYLSYHPMYEQEYYNDLLSFLNTNKIKGFEEFYSI